MSQPPPAVNARQVLAALRHAGFVVDRIVGSHHVLVHPATLAEQSPCHFTVLGA
jgi:predicted RNA binding protein YcfA (HicA-like mRNA interferase family)